MYIFIYFNNLNRHHLTTNNTKIVVINSNIIFKNDIRNICLLFLLLFDSCIAGLSDERPLTSAKRKRTAKLTEGNYFRGKECADAQ